MNVIYDEACFKVKLQKEQKQKYKNQKQNMKTIFLSTPLKFISKPLLFRLYTLYAYMPRILARLFI